MSDALALLTSLTETSMLARTLIRQKGSPCPTHGCCQPRRDRLGMLHCSLAKGCGAGVARSGQHAGRSRAEASGAARLSSPGLIFAGAMQGRLPLA